MNIVQNLRSECPKSALNPGIEYSARLHKQDFMTLRKLSLKVESDFLHPLIEIAGDITKQTDSHLAIALRAKAPLNGKKSPRVNALIAKPLAL